MAEQRDAQQYPPFDLALVRPNPDVVADTVGGKALSRVLAVLPGSSITFDALARTATPDQADEALADSIFLRTLGDTLASETADEIHLTPKRAREFGACVAAATVQTTATGHGSYAVDFFAGDLHKRARHLEQTDVAECQEADRLDVWARAAFVLDDPNARTRLAEAMMEELALHVDIMSLAQAASAAARHLDRMDTAEGNEAALHCNPWDQKLIEATTQHGALAQLTRRSSFAGAMRVAITSEGPPALGLSSKELYAQGINRLLAYVAVGTSLLAEQPLPGAGPARL